MRDNKEDLVLFEIRKQLKSDYPSFGKSLIKSISRNLLPLFLRSNIDLRKFLTKELVEESISNSKLGKQFLQNIKRQEAEIKAQQTNLKLREDVKKDYPKSYEMIMLSIPQYTFENYFLNLTKGLEIEFPKELYLKVSNYLHGTQRNYRLRGYEVDTKFVQFGNQLIKNKVINIVKLFNLCDDEFKRVFHKSLTNFDEFKHLITIRDLTEFLKLKSIVN